MLSDKKIKEKYKPIFWKDPEKYYATEVLKKEGFARAKCSQCKRPFWDTNKKRKVCGDPACSNEESFAFIGKTPAKNKLTYIDVWKKFSEMFKKFGYTPIKRYPVVARWNPTMEYTNASIAAFQPYVISGEVEPPANPLTIPQFCLRFTDIDNVGITESHNTGFVMIGQHMFVPPKDWNQNQVFEHIYTWLTKGLGLPKEEITFHEDAWAGGGNLGPCMEYFSRGCELGNQVYMLYEQTPKGVKELDIKVLDMGLGMERNAWFSQGCETIYDAAFPTVIEKLVKITGFKPDKKLLQKYVPHAGRLNIDEVDDIDKAWKLVAKKVGVPVDKLRKQILPLSAIYSIAEHSRSVLISLHDGFLPSNTGGGYNLRILIRRMLSFIEQYNWDIHAPDVLKWHAEYLKPIFPELLENFEDTKKLLEVEMNKFESTRQKSRHLMEKLVKQKVTTEKLIELYDSNGIAPEIIREEAEKVGKKIKVPENFYALVAERHEKAERVAQKKEISIDINLKNIQETKALYYDDWKKKKFKAKVLKIKDKYVVLDQTYFYPTSGGQDHDLGTMDMFKVVDAAKQGPHIIHILDKKPGFKEGDKVEVTIDFDRRLQLAQHHTGTHVLGAAARKVLGPHINQAGAKKTIEKAHLDITHYENLSEQQTEQIEKEANKIITKKIKVEKGFFPRTEAEKKFGTTIYQGGVAPGKILRIVHIKGVDVQACGGTHLDNTNEIEKIKVLKTTKIQDGVVRLIFTAGKAAKQESMKEDKIIDECSKLLCCNPNQVPKKAEELFVKWKKVKKLKKKGKEITKADILLTSTEESSGDLLSQTADILKTQPENVTKTINRFLSELKP